MFNSLFNKFSTETVIITFVVSIIALYYVLYKKEIGRRVKILVLLYLIDFKKNKKEKQLLKNNIIKFIIFFSTFIFSTYASTYSDFFVITFIISFFPAVIYFFKTVFSLEKTLKKKTT